jgi:DNA-binding XRE family transcriptional regulator
MARPNGQWVPTLLQAFRKDAGMTQSEVALRLGVAQQTYSALERNAGKFRATLWNSRWKVSVAPA